MTPYEKEIFNFSEKVRAGTGSFLWLCTEICNIEVTEKSTFDCTKICVTKPVQDSIIRYYSEYQKLSDEEIGTKLLLCGPKANLIGAGYEVEVEDGFVIEGK